MAGIALVVATHYSPAVLNNFGYSVVTAIVVPLVNSVICLPFDSNPISVDSAGDAMLRLSKSSLPHSHLTITGIDLYDVASCTIHKKWLNFLAEFSGKY